MKNAVRSLSLIIAVLVLSISGGSPLQASELNSQDFQIAIGDFNGDGKSDLLYIAKDPGRPSGIASGDASGGPNTDWQSWPSHFLGIPWHSGNYNPVVGDFNGDGRSDLLMQTTSVGGWSYLLFTNSEGKFDVASIHQAIPDYCQGLYLSTKRHRILAGNFVSNGNGTQTARRDLFLQATNPGGTHALMKFTPISTAFGERAELTCAASVSQSWADGLAGLKWNAVQAVVHVGNFNGDTYDDLFVQAHPDWVMIDYEVPFPVPSYRPNSFGIVLANSTGTIQSSAWQVWSRMQNGIDWSAANTNAVVGYFDGNARADILLQSKRTGGLNYWFAADTNGQFTLGTPTATLSNFGAGNDMVVYAANFNASSSGSGLYLQRTSSAGGANAYTNSIAGSATAHDYASILPNNSPVDTTLVTKPVPGTAVGSIPGEFSVDPTGAANYHIPIAVPPGVAGVAPDLALAYSSRGGNGLVGVGFSLSGISAITRCGTGVQPDGQNDGVDFDADDQFCLDGQRLILKSGPHGASGAEYRTELESHQKVVLVAVDGTNGPTRFTVHDKAGLIRDYGLADSPAGTDALIKARKQGVNGPNFVWSIKRIRDRFDNFIEYSYTQDANSTNFWPTSVVYGSKWNGSRAEVGRVAFVYTARSDNASGYLPKGYTTSLTQRLQRIDVYGRSNPLASTTATALARQYFLNYELSTTSLLSHLKSVVLCDAGTGVNQRCFKDTKFNWQFGYRGLAQQWSNSAIKTQWMRNMKLADVDGDGRLDYIANKDGTVQWHVRRGRLNAPEEGFVHNKKDPSSAIVMDWDSDGYQDLVQRSTDTSSGGKYEILPGSATGWGTAAQPKVTSTIDAKGLSGNSGATAVGDFDGDGRQDIAYVSMSGFANAVGETLTVHRNPAAVNSLSTIPLETYALVDAYGSAIVEEDSSIRTLNFDGDGRDDIGVLVRHCWTTGGVHWVPAIQENVPNTSCTNQLQVYSMTPTGTLEKVFPVGARLHESMVISKVKLLDSNGDGFTDLLAYDASISGWRLAIGTGDPATSWALGGWGVSTLAASQCTDTWTYYEGIPEYQGCITANFTLTQQKLDEAVIVDHDRDGRTDVLFADGGVWQVLLATNTGFKSTVLTTDRTAYQPGSAMVIDDRGDGIADIVSPQNAGASADFMVYYGRGPLSGLIEKITDGLGAQTFVQHVALTTLDPSTHQPVAYKGHTPFNETTQAPVFPYSHFAAPLPVVYQFAADNGLGPENGTHGMVRTTYEYRGLKVHRQGRGLLGFGEVRSWNDNSEIETGNRMAQAFPYTGMLLTSEQRFKNYAAYSGSLTLNFNGQTILLDYATLCETSQICANINPGEMSGWTYTPGNPDYKRASYTTNTLNVLETTYGTLKTYFPYVRKSIAEVYPVQGGSPVGTTPYKVTTSEYVSSSGVTADSDGSPAYDSNGNPKVIRVTTANGSGGDVHRLTTANTYQDELSTWCLGRLTATTVTHEKPNINGVPNAGPYNVVRNATFAYQSGTACVLNQETTATNDGSPSLTKTYAYDTYGNRYSETVSGSDIAVADQRTSGAIASGGGSSYAASYGQFPTRAQNALGHAETTTWDGRFGTALTTTGPNGLTATSAQDSFGRQSRETPVSALSSIYSTQELNWCGAVGCVDGRSIYTARTAASDGSESYAEFDRLGRQVHARKRHFDGGWIQAEKYYDPLGREYLSSDAYNPAIHSTRCWNWSAFDALGRPIRTESSNATTDCTSTPPAFNTSPGFGQVNEITYDLMSSNGIATKTVANASDTGGYATARTGYKVVNVMGRTRFVRDDLSGGGCPSDGGAQSANTPNCLQTEYDYDAQGNLTYTKQVSSTGTTLETRVTFNNRGFKTQMSDPDMGNWSYGYNAFGELKNQTDAKNQLTTLTYDKLGRLKTRVEGSEGTTTFNYDTASQGVGKIASITAPGSYTETYSYDSYGRLSRLKRQIGSEYFYIDQTYDSLGRVDIVKYPGAVNGDTSSGPEADANRLRVRNNYNSFGYLASVSDAASSTVYWQANSVDEAGHVREERLGNGLYTQRAFQRETGHLLQIATGTSAGGTQIQDLQFTFDQAANLRVRKDRSPGVNSGAGIRETFGYDKLYRLVQTVQVNDNTGSPMAATQNYAYDEFGNLTAKGTAYSNYTYPTTRTGCDPTTNHPHAVHAVTASGTTRTYCYDANGNAISASSAKFSTLTWWVSNLVKRVSSGSSYTEFTYGPDRARFKQYRYRSGTDTETTLSVGALYEKRTQVQSGTTTIRHTHYIRAGDQVIATAQRTKVGANPVGNVVYRYLHRDHLGSVTALTDAGGALLERSGFDPWGKRTDFSTWAPPNPLQFLPGGSGAGGTTNAVTSTARGYTGHEQVDELGFIHMNGRIYDPETGRFLSADPTMQFPESTQGFNRYAYAGNNPLTNVDPSGFSFLKSLIKIVGLAMMFIIPTGINLLWEKLLWGFMSGFLATGGNTTAGVIAGLTAGLMYGIGGVFQKANTTILANGSKIIRELTNLQKVGKALLHGLVGGAGSSAAKGKFADGFLGAFSGSLTNSYIRLSGGPLARAVQSAVIGGTVSAIGGSKFGSGAIAAAFVALYNDLAHGIPYSVDDAIGEIQRDKSLSEDQRQARLYEMKHALTTVQKMLYAASTEQLNAWFGSSLGFAQDRVLIRVGEAIAKVDAAIAQSSIRGVAPGAGDLASSTASVASHFPRARAPIIGILGDVRGIFDLMYKGYQFGNRPFQMQVELCNGGDCATGGFRVWVEPRD